MGKIYCKSCMKYLGNIEGSIHKEIVYLCKHCNIQREVLELRYKEKDTNSENYFKDLLKGYL